MDPRFANAGAMPLASGYGAQQMPMQSNRPHRHHRHHKNKHSGTGESPLSRDESIHKVDHGQQNFLQNDGAVFGAGYGVPYGAGGFYQQTAYAGSNFGFANQYQGNGFNQGQYAGGVVAPRGKHHRRHRHHHHQNNEAAGGATNDQLQGAPEQLLGQRSASALESEAPIPGMGQPGGEKATMNINNPNAELSSFGKGHQSRQAQGHTRAEADGYGHINDDLIFIERGDHSPHRQQAPSGYEYKGKIEVQGIDREIRSKLYSHSTGGAVITQPSVPVPQVAQTVISSGPCPPGWQQMALSAAPGGPCPPCSSTYTGQLLGAGAATFSTGTSYGGLANLAASLPIPPQCQLVADYIIQGGGGGSNFQDANFETHRDSEQKEEHTTGRATIIEVWQKKSRGNNKHNRKPDNPKPDRSTSSSSSRGHSPVRSRPQSPKPGPAFDFERFRSEILIAIERLTQGGGSGGKIPWSGHDGGTQTEIREIHINRPIERPKTPTNSSGEVRVIVQPIQPVFYMPRQTESAQKETVVINKTITDDTNRVGPAPPPIQPLPNGAPNVIYIPRNVYVPVIKPVFVPRERVIVRPQVIHVARPVLVDRPVPVTQRPIIIDRERPVPVPVRTCEQAAAAAAEVQTTGSKVVREEYVYRDNLPVAYGGRCAEYAGGANYGYTQTEQNHQYVANSTQEVSGGYEAQGSAGYETQGSAGYETQGSVINVAVPNLAEPYPNTGLSGVGGIEVLDTNVSSTWQRTDKTSLETRYGGPAVDIMQKTDQAEQQMYQELRQRSSSGGIQRSHSTASYGSGSGGVIVCAEYRTENMSNVNY